MCGGKTESTLCIQLGSEFYMEVKGTLHGTKGAHSAYCKLYEVGPLLFLFTAISPVPKIVPGGQHISVE